MMLYSATLHYLLVPAATRIVEGLGTYTVGLLNTPLLCISTRARTVIPFFSCSRKLDRS